MSPTDKASPLFNVKDYFKAHQTRSRIGQMQHCSQPNLKQREKATFFSSGTFFTSGKDDFVRSCFQSSNRFKAAEEKSHGPKLDATATTLFPADRLAMQSQSNYSSKIAHAEESVSQLSQKSRNLDIMPVLADAQNRTESSLG